MNDLPVPGIEPDARPVQIPTTAPEGFEYGAHTFGRALTTVLGRLLHEDITAPVFRCNPFGRRPCPYATSYTFTAAGHTILLVTFEDPRGLPAYALHLNGQRIAFDLHRYGDSESQLATVVWMAIRDRPPAEPPGTAGAGMSNHPAVLARAPNLACDNASELRDALRRGAAIR